MPCMPFLSCMMSDAEQRRRQFIFAKNRSLSAPTRKKWYRRDSHHQDHDKATLYDTVLAQKLADAIQVWHEFHSSLSQLAIDPNDHRKKSEDNLENDDEKLETYERSASCMAPQATIISSDEDLEEECESDFSESEDEATSSSSINVSESELPEDNTTEESLDTMEELAKFEKHTKLHGKLSISNPDLTTIQLKSIFPKLHKHWRLV